MLHRSKVHMQYGWKVQGSIATRCTAEFGPCCPIRKNRPVMILLVFLLESSWWVCSDPETVGICCTCVLICTYTCHAPSNGEIVTLVTSHIPPGRDSKMTPVVVHTIHLFCASACPIMTTQTAQQQQRVSSSACWTEQRYSHGADGKRKRGSGCSRYRPA